MQFPRATRLLLGFQWGTDADRFRQSMGERLRKFGLELHPDKTRRIEFGRGDVRKTACTDSEKVGHVADHP